MAARIREFQIDDYQQVARLWGEANIRVESMEDVFAKLRRDPDLFLVADDGGIIIGVVVGAFDGRFASINRLAVTASARRRGLATRLIQAVEERAREKGARRIWAWIEDENAASRAFFARHGFQEWSDVVTASKPLG